MTEGLTGLLIHLVVPLAGMAGYAMLAVKLRQQGASALFLAQLFLIFCCWGGLLMLVLTSLFWRWSGMASLGAGFLFLIAPFLMGAPVFAWPEYSGLPWRSAGLCGPVAVTLRLWC